MGKSIDKQHTHIHSSTLIAHEENFEVNETSMQKKKN